VIGAYTITSSTFEIITMAVFGGVGYLFHKLGCEPAPLLLGFILGPMMEENLRRSLVLSHGDFSVFVTSPISLALLSIAALLLIVMVLPSISKTREEAFQED
jgi:TctA family transporter